jgi:hypothetical protein
LEGQVTAQELSEWFNKHQEQISADDRIMIVVERLGIGATPAVEIDSISIGIDWNRGRILLRAKSPLREADEPSARVL